METIKTEYTSLERKPIIDEGLRDLLPALSEEAHEALTLDILQNGCYSPMICMEDMTLVDGHNRYTICEENDVLYRMVVLPFEDKLAAKQWALDTQKARRNLTTWELGQIALKLRPEIEARAKERMSDGGGDKRSGDARSGMATLPNPIQDAGSTRKELADAAGIGERTMGKIMKIEEEAPESIKDAVENSDISIHKGYDLTKKLRDLPEDEREAAALSLLEQAYKKDNTETNRASGIATHIDKIFELIMKFEVTEENAWHWIEWCHMRRPELAAFFGEIDSYIKKLERFKTLLEQIYSSDWRNPYDSKAYALDAVGALIDEWHSEEGADGNTEDIPDGEQDQQFKDGGDSAKV